MTSTVLDVALCLLLVSAAAVTVATVDTRQAPTTDRADAVATTLSATTAEVNYSLAPGARAADPSVTRFDRTAGPAFERTAHGTLASLLARATVRSVRVDGEPLTHASDDFRQQVVAATRERLPARTQVVVRWHPSPDADLGRTLTVGPSPPSTADVHAATVEVPSGVPAARPSPAPTSRRALAHAVAESIVAGLFPPAKGRHALAGDPPVSKLVAHRYRRGAAAVGLGAHALDDDLAADDATDANARLRAAVAGWLTAEFRAADTSPGPATTRLDLDTVHVVVRTWGE